MASPALIAGTTIGTLGVLSLLRYLRHRIKRSMRINRHRAYLGGLNASMLPERPPNIVIIFCDDLGYADISCFGGTAIKTPHIDSIAAQGAVMTNFYSSSPVCSPSRAGLLTGRLPPRMFMNMVLFPKNSPIDILFKIAGVYRYGVKGILPDEITLAEVLQRVSYSTALIGKWHLGDFKPHRPNDKGFDFFYGAYYSNDMKPYAIYRNTEVDIPAPADQNTLTKRLTEETLAFIEQNVDKPFFIHYCQPFPHNPVHASKAFRGSSQGGLYGDCVQEVDWSVGQIISTLERHSLLENTLIIFTSDNGPWHEGNPGYHRGRKALNYEGGQRVPMIAMWKGKIPAGIKIDAPAMNIDLFPTILNLLNLPLPNDRIIDGKDIMPLLMGKTNEGPHKYLYYVWGRKIKAIRRGRWKYHVKHMSDNSKYFNIRVGPFLFDLQVDENESYDQTAHYSEVAEELALEVERMNASLRKNPRGWK